MVKNCDIHCYSRLTRLSRHSRLKNYLNITRKYVSVITENSVKRCLSVYGCFIFNDMFKLIPCTNDCGLNTTYQLAKLLVAK